MKLKKVMASCPLNHFKEETCLVGMSEHEWAKLATLNFAKTLKIMNNNIFFGLKEEIWKKTLKFLVCGLKEQEKIL